MSDMDLKKVRFTKKKTEPLFGGYSHIDDITNNMDKPRLDHSTNSENYMFMNKNDSHYQNGSFVDTIAREISFNQQF
tara:strand:+ start:504 stop:734 length:231 start_codon:yes stop_codon:yes gene_type:complete